MYKIENVKDLIDRYINAGGEMYTLEEGVLGYGLTVLVDFTGKLKNFVIKEKYLNEWSSGHTIRGYRQLPEKYLKMIEKQYN